MKLKKVMAIALSAGMVFTAQPALAEDAGSEAASVVETAESTAEADEADAAAEDEATPVAESAADPETAQKLDTYYTLALNAINTEDYETADKYLDICFAYCDPQTDPTLYADLMLKRACIAVINGETDMALNELDAALKVQPDLADAYLVRTQIYTGLGDIDRAVESLETYIELTEDTSLYETVAQLHEANGDLDQAAAAYDKYVEGSGEEVEEAGFQSGLYSMEGGKYEEAIEAFEAYADDEVYGAGAMYNIGLCRMNLGEFAEAVAAFTSCEEKGGQFEGLYYNRGVSSLLGGDPESAAADFEKSMETESYVADALYNLGISKMQMEDYEGAIDTFTELIGDGDERAAAESEDAAEETAEETAEGETEEVTEETAEGTAEGETEEVAEETGDEMAEESVAEAAEGESEEAADETEEAEAAESEADASEEDTVEYPVNYGAYYYRAVCEGAIGALDAAIADYTVCIDNGYELSQSYYQRAQVYAALGDTENQTADLESSLQAAE